VSTRSPGAAATASGGGPEDPSPTAELAAFAAGLEPEDLPAAVVDRISTCVLDTLGCALFGATLPWCGMVTDLVAEEGGSGGAALWGTAVRGTPTQAALANGTAGHSFEMDDLHHKGGLHPGAVTVPAALALAARTGADGPHLLAALVAGYEVGARVGMSVAGTHFRAGFHPQGTVGAFAAAATAGRMLGLDALRMRHALGIAGSEAAGLMAAQEGAMVKRLHSGRAAQSGVYAALLAERGFTGTPDVFEAGFGGFLSTMGGSATHPERLTEGLGRAWETLGVGFKAYASCAAVHTSLDIARRLRAEHGLRGPDVAHVSVRTSTSGYLHVGWPYQARDVTAAQMSMGYGVARMLMDGEVSVAQFTPAAIRDPAALALVERIEIRPDETIDALGHDLRHTCHMEVRTTDGRVLAGSADRRRGSVEHPMSADELRAKFRTLAGAALSGERVEAVAAAVAGLPDLARATDLDDLLAVGPQGHGGA
jgi:2-methylcitrate dehydratase PrpD